MGRITVEETFPGPMPIIISACLLNYRKYARIVDSSVNSGVESVARLSIVPVHPHVLPVFQQKYVNMDSTWFYIAFSC